MNIVYVGTVASQIMVIIEMWQILATRFIEVVQLMIILTQYPTYAVKSKM